MKANFTRVDGSRLGLRFEPETFEEQLLLEQFTREAYRRGHRFEFSSWEHNCPRTLREGLTSCWGQLVQCEAVRANKINEESQRTTGASGQKVIGVALKSTVETASAKTKTALSTKQRERLTRLQESCRVIGAHEGCSSWAVLGCALEAALAAIDGEGALAAVHREQLETYLARSDTDYGIAGIEEALCTLLAVTKGRDEGKGPDAQASSVVVAHSMRDGRAVRVDLKALVDGCSRIILERPRDGSPPMIAINADVALAVATFAQRLSCGIVEAPSPGETRRLQKSAAEGPIVEGEGAADAWGSGIHPIHVSAVR